MLGRIFGPMKNFITVLITKYKGEKICMVRVAGHTTRTEEIKNAKKSLNFKTVREEIP